MPFDPCEPNAHECRNSAAVMPCFMRNVAEIHDITSFPVPRDEKRKALFNNLPGQILYNVITFYHKKILKSNGKKDSPGFIGEPFLLARSVVYCTNDPVDIVPRICNRITKMCASGCAYLCVKNIYTVFGGLNKFAI